MTAEYPALTPPSPTAAYDAGRRVQIMLDYLPLPAPIVIGRPERAHVLVTDVEDLLPWLQHLGGEVHVAPAGTGMELWTLRTKTVPLGDGSTLPVWVSAPLPVGELVAAELRAAARPDGPVDGPFRVGVTHLPAGAGLDVSHYLTHVLIQLAQVAEEDPEGVLSDLQDIASLARSAHAQGPDSHAVHERDAQVEKLLTEVAGDGVMPVYGAQVSRLVERLMATQRCPRCSGTFETCTCGKPPLPPGGGHVARAVVPA